MTTIEDLVEQNSGRDRTAALQLALHLGNVLEALANKDGKGRHLLEDFEIRISPWENTPISSVTVTVSYVDRGVLEKEGP